jgi:biopolymer transport protein TolR
MTSGRLPDGRADRCFSAIGALESTTVRISPTRRTARRSNDLICHINVTGFVSVMLALLFMFMVKDPVCSFGRGVPVDLTKVSYPVPMRAADREEAMIVLITRDDKIFFRTDKVRVDELPDKIRESVSQGSEKKVYISADARAKYLWVAEVLDNVRSTGVERIGFLVDQRRPPAPNSQ